MTPILPGKLPTKTPILLLSDKCICYSIFILLLYLTCQPWNREIRYSYYYIGCLEIICELGRINHIYSPWEKKEKQYSA